MRRGVLTRPRTWSAPVATGALVVLALTGCSLWGMEGGPGGAGAAVPSGSAAQSTVDAVVGPDGVQRVTVTLGDDLRMHPAEVRARPGRIEFTFHDTGALPHEVHVTTDTGGGQTGGASQTGGAGQAADTGNLDSGQSAVVTVTVRRPGRYPFPCVYHESSGMVGTLLVS
jgi:plastocyanin